MAELTDSRMNVAALKRVDPYVKNLLETAAHVALYTFNANDNEWEKTDVEGALFVYSRTGEPYNNILIMNRLNMKNLVEPVTQGLDLQLQDPFLLYRNTQGKIYGIWFYDKEECVKIASILTKLVKETAENKNQGLDKKVKRKIENNVSGVDIFTMLTKAQEEYNSKSPQKSQKDFVGTPPDTNNLSFSNIDSTPQSVMEFFAKASSGVNPFQDKPPAQLPGALPEALFLGMARPGPPGLTQIQPIPIGIPPSQNDVKPLLQRLMSNPAHSVEHIEKQQQSITPQTELAALMRNKVPSASDPKNRNIIGNGFKGLQISSVQCNANNTKQVLTPQSHIENELGFLRIADTSPTAVVQTQQFYNSGLVQKHSPTAGDAPLDVNSSEHRSLSAPQVCAMETPTKPALMPPVMFTSSVTKDELPSTIPVIMPAINVVAASVNTQQNNINSLQLQPEPLTKNQLLQAFSYLLKNDPNFINQLHEAYVKSFA